MVHCVHTGYSHFRDMCLFDINIWIILSDIFKFLSRSSHAEHATLTKNNTSQCFRNDLNGLNAHGSFVFLHVEYPVSVHVSILSTTVVNH